MRQEFIRNFSIIAHIDHGKSTLADRLLEKTGLVEKGTHLDQILDTMELERERGITIKAQTATMNYTGIDGNTYYLNLIDTPGHVDFSYEVSRALAACEGVLLIIDASQGVEAQTMANMYLAVEHDLEIIPVINKIDLPGADIEMTKKQIKHDLGLDPEMAIPVSAKEGTNIESVLEAIVKHIPYPKGSESSPLQMLIFDANYDNYRGVVISGRVIEGSIRQGQEIKMINTGGVYTVEEVGYFKIAKVPAEKLEAGDVGYILATIKNIQDTRIGDTITDLKNPAKKALSGYKEVKPMVFSGIYPVEGDDYPLLAEALEKLQLNDAALVFEKESSVALGFGYRCGFLGLLHMEIVEERLDREFDLNLICTAPSVQYDILLKNGKQIIVDNPTNYPDPGLIENAEEPYVDVEILVPNEYLGPIMNIIQERRGFQTNMHYMDEKRVQVDCELPLAEIIYDFHDKIKSISRGFASYDYHLKGYKPTELVKVDILVNKSKVDAFSQLVHKDKAYRLGRFLVDRLKDVIPPHMFQIPIQATIGGSIIARSTIRALKKNVTAKCYGGDITRKRKLLEKQKEGKKRMRQFGNVNIPKQAFIDVLKSED